VTFWVKQMAQNRRTVSRAKEALKNEEVISLEEPAKEKEMNKLESKVYGVDVGTMFYQVAQPDPTDPEGALLQSKRNSFVEMPADEDHEDTLKSNNWEYVKDGKTYYVIGEDSLNVVNLFPNGAKLRRPLASGVLNKDESKGLVVLSKIVEKTLGRAPTPDSVVCTCISSESADGSPDSLMHKSRLISIFTNLGYQVKVIEEGEAVIASEEPVMEEDGKQIPLSGIGISFGAGRVNCVMSYRGKKIIGMSASRSGDWIDKKVEEATGKPLTQITKKKETKLDLASKDEEDPILYGNIIYHREMFKYVLSKFIARFKEVQSDYEGKKIEIVVAGGTSSPKGFLELMKEVVGEMDVPFVIKGIRHASDPRNAVVKGLLIHALNYQEKIREKKDKELEEALGT
jgi:hypothetical protein